MRRSIRSSGLPLAFAGVLALVAASPPAPAAAFAPAHRSLPRASVPGTRCTAFPADNVWNTDISELPVDPHSAEWLHSMHAASTDLHPDFGPPHYGMPYTVVKHSTKRSAVHFRYGSQSDHARYPFTRHTPIEGGSDRHAIMLDRSNCKLYELYAARWNKGHPHAGSGAIFNLRSDALRPAGWTSADAAGLPILPGLVRYDEIARGFIGHAIRLTADVTTSDYVWPARHQAGVSDPDAPPMGARFRLAASFDLSGFSSKARVVLRAMKTYGLILADNGSDWYFQGTRDKRWRNNLLDELKSVPASAFEAVDESACQVSADSARAAC
jgi:hypothetical protein